jgi:hypothetical protein
MQIPFEDVPLEKEQTDLLAEMVEAERATDASHRQPFLLIRVMGGNFLQHPGLTRESVYPADLQSLAEYGLLRLNYGSSGSEMFDVTPVGRRYYAWLKEQEGEPVVQLETEIRRLLDAAAFRERHAAAYDRWARAQAELWGAETPAALTEIGHACREAIQLFVTDLVEKHQPAEVDSDPQHTVARLRAVIAAAGLSENLAALAEALLTYFGPVSDLVQRQEHGAQKEGEALRWEDARRVVFHTASVMFELDRTLG